MNALLAVTPLLAISMPKDIGSLGVWLIIVIAVVAIVVVACQAMKVEIPAWAKNVLWIVLIAAVCILAIKFLMSISW